LAHQFRMGLSSHIIPISETSSNAFKRNLALFRVIAGRLLCHSVWYGWTRWKAARMNLRHGESFVPLVPARLFLVLGVLWSPAGPKRRRLVRKLTLPGGRRIGGARKRGKHCAGFAASCPRSSLLMTSRGSAGYYPRWGLANS
jgi:hypothetical protein